MRGVTVDLRDELLVQLKHFREFKVVNLVCAEDYEKKFVFQTAIYDHVALVWGKTYIKFWDGDEKNTYHYMFINADIIKADWFQTDGGGSKAVIQISGCPDPVEIICII
ncbi:hypothetical protein [Sinanaerobacter chloroacetimidivorans]|uniref:Uncharacterized protein n=1 Tax=Sinanaerobacter chloroacetimidivorans TaxID=2818044 RepID=A0A8J7VZQ7_9FIRM|nr:hypothetical protein [Sinanaerobacter chloroacetimidivorans]MBR0596953.1 hypothetical protein [Sinanaerobacter chloroacetimidivorans]